MSDIKINRKILDLVEKRKKFVLLSLVESRGKSAGEAGRKMIVTREDSIGSIGGGDLEWKSIKHARKILEEDKAHKKLKEISNVGEGCGGTWKVFFEYYGLYNRLIIFGAGHVARAVYDVMNKLDFEIIVVDDREYLLREENFPEAKLINSREFNLKDIGLDENTYVLIAGKSHDIDENIVSSLLEEDLKYIGLIGSKSKILNIEQNLNKKNLSLKDKDNIYAPVGLSVAKGKPNEIAISIASEILSVKNNTEIFHMRDSLD